MGEVGRTDHDPTTSLLPVDSFVRIPSHPPAPRYVAEGRGSPGGTATGRLKRDGYPPQPGNFDALVGVNHRTRAQQGTSTLEL